MSCWRVGSALKAIDSLKDHAEKEEANLDIVKEIPSKKTRVEEVEGGEGMD